MPNNTELDKLQNAQEKMRRDLVERIKEQDMTRLSEPTKNLLQDWPRQHDTFESLAKSIAELRAVFFERVPESIDDDRFAQMMGSPECVVHFVTEWLREQVEQQKDDPWTHVE